MIKKIFGFICLIVFMTLTNTVFADMDMTFENVEYLLSDNSMVIDFPEAGTEVTSGIKVTNASNEAKSITLVTVIYTDNQLVMLKYLQKDIEGKNSEDIAVAFEIPQGATANNSIVKSYVIDNILDFNPYINPAAMLCDSTEIADLYIDGGRFEDFSGVEDLLKIQITSGTAPKIKAMPADSTSKVDVVNADRVPGFAKIKVTSQFGEIHETEILFYNEIDDLYTLQNLKYYIGADEYSIENFDKNTTTYEVELPDNTFYVRMAPESIQTDVTMQAQDVDISAKTFDGIQYLKGSKIASYAGFTSPRTAFNGVVPVKNEETKGLINVTDGKNSTTYTIVFKSKQPRLTAFNVTGGENDLYQPTFIGGAAVNNDNYTLAGTDRGWGYANISQNLVGGSMFMMDLAQNRNSTSWFCSSNNTGEYFNFTADTAGTIYFMSNVGVTNTQFFDDGWERVTNPAPSKPAGIDSWIKVNKLWNDYESDRFFMMKYEWTNAAAKTNPENYEYYSGQPNGTAINGLIKKEFNAGESVSVYHPGRSGGGNNPIMTAVIVWNTNQ